MKNNFIKLFVFAKKIQIIKLIYLSIIASFITSINEAGIMYLSQVLVYKISGNNLDLGSFKNETLIYFSTFSYEILALFFVFIAFIRSIIIFLSGYFSSLVEINAITNLREKLFKGYYYNLESNITKSELNTFSGEVFPKIGSMYYFAIQSIIILIQIVTIACVLIYLSPKLFLITFFLFFLVFLLTKKNAKLISFYSSQIPVNIYQLNHGIEKYANNKLLVYLLGKISHEHRLVKELNKKYQFLSEQAIKYSNILPAFLPFGGSIMIVIFCFISFEFKVLDTTRLISFLYGIFRIVQISSSFSGSVSNFLKLIPNLNVYTSYVDKIENNKYFRGLIVDPPVATDNLLGVSFDQVSFSYDDDLIVFDNFSFKINPGSFVGIVGQSGSGKSTLISLILGVKLPKSGLVKFNNQVGEEVEINKVMFGYVGPTPLLFEDSLRNNLVYGNNKDISDEVIIEMLSGLNMYSKVSSLPGGLNFIYKEDSNVFSTGQLQRLCICRAMLSSSNILILDEATSNLDTKNEISILKDLNKNKSNMTVIFISHRKTFFEYADEIFDLDRLKYCEK